MSDMFDHLLPEQLWLLEYFARKNDWLVIDGPRTANLHSLGLLERQSLPPFVTYRLSARGGDVVERFHRRLRAARIDIDEAYEQAKVSAQLPVNA